MVFPWLSPAPAPRCLQGLSDAHWLSGGYRSRRPALCGADVHLHSLAAVRTHRRLRRAIWKPWPSGNRWFTHWKWWFSHSEWWFTHSKWWFFHSEWWFTHSKWWFSGVMLVCWPEGRENIQRSWEWFRDTMGLCNRMQNNGAMMV